MASAEEKECETADERMSAGRGPGAVLSNHNTSRFAVAVGLLSHVKDDITDYVMSTGASARGATEGMRTLDIKSAVAQAATNRLRGETGSQSEALGRDVRFGLKREGGPQSTDHSHVDEQVTCRCSV